MKKCRKHLVARAGVIVCAGLGLLLCASAYITAQDAAVEKTLVANERTVNEAVVKGDLTTFKKFVAADGWSIDGEGRNATAEFIKTFPQMTKDMKIASWDVSDFKTIWVDPNTAVVTYKWTGKGTYQGQPIPSPTWSSTVWTKRSSNWIAVYHQESLGMPAPAAK
jgi:hypothetical protein